jgi:cytochrome c553
MAFKSGEYKDPLMGPMAAGPSEKDMEDLAAFFRARMRNKQAARREKRSESRVHHGGK